jgi:hypothetical protein
MYLRDRPDGFREILEGSLAEREAKCILRERHRRGISFPEVDLPSGFGRVPAGDLDKGFADIKSADLIVPRFASSMQKYPGPGAISSTRPFTGICPDIRCAIPLCRFRSLRVVFAYQEAMTPSIGKPL